MIENKIIRFKELRKIIPLSRNTIWRKMKIGTFPKSIQLGIKSIGWLEKDIEGWINQKKEER